MPSESSIACCFEFTLASATLADHLKALGGGGGIMFRAVGRILLSPSSIKEATTGRAGLRVEEVLLSDRDPTPSSMILACRATSEHTKQACCWFATRRDGCCPACRARMLRQRL
jgi:hypothetical protein